MTSKSTGEEEAKTLQALLRFASVYDTGRHSRAHDLPKVRVGPSLSSISNQPGSEDLELIKNPYQLASLASWVGANLCNLNGSRGKQLIEDGYRRQSNTEKRTTIAHLLGWASVMPISGHFFGQN